MISIDGEKLNRLIMSVANGYTECLDGIYELAGRKMFAVALSVAGRQLAEDVLQESFIKIARFAKKYSHCDNPSGWLCRIVKNTALDFLRQKNQRSEVSTEEFFNLTSSDYNPERRDDALALEQALSKLDRDEKKIIHCVYYLDMTVREIAKELGTSKSAVQRLKEKAENNLKTLLGDGTNE